MACFALEAACRPRPRIEALKDGSVDIEGVDLVVRVTSARANAR
jgi:hypothetical protein